jgi:tetratricopeptide (TPR) repeat protein
MKHMMTVAAILISACGGSSPSPASAPASEPTEAVGKPPALTYGQHHHPIQTSIPDAQKLFDQGMAQSYGFNHEAAIRSFERASELDPKAAMPHWGRAWALGPNYNLDIDDPRAKAAYDAITRARELAVAPDERAYVDALAVRYSPDMKANRAALARAYSNAMRDLARRHPDDLDAAVLYAESLMNLTPWKLWTLDGKPNANTEEIVRVLESVLQRNPNHLGANHFYIHAVEASRMPGRALPSAARLTTLAEQSGHLLHMPAHIYAHGDHAGAAAAKCGRRCRRSALSGDRSQRALRDDTSHNLHFWPIPR